jgi:hypothetical protein
MAGPRLRPSINSTRCMRRRRQELRAQYEYVTSFSPGRSCGAVVPCVCTRLTPNCRSTVAHTTENTHDRLELSLAERGPVIWSGGTDSSSGELDKPPIPLFSSLPTYVPPQEAIRNRHLGFSMMIGISMRIHISLRRF